MADQEQRKSTDVILSLETKIDQLLQVNRNLDFNIKILSNKLNQLLDVLTSTPSITSSPLSSFPSAELPPNESINSQTVVFPQESNPMTTDVVPVGFRRTSRPETFDEPGQVVEATPKNVPTPSIPVPAMHPPLESKPSTAKNIPSSANRHPVMQRIVDKNGKAVFMAEVEIVNSKNITELKTRTNGVGKWQASLMPGQYKVNIKKQGGVGKEKIEISQNLTIDSATPDELQVLIIK